MKKDYIRQLYRYTDRIPILNRLPCLTQICGCGTLNYHEYLWFSLFNSNFPGQANVHTNCICTPYQCWGQGQGSGVSVLFWHRFFRKVVSIKWVFPLLIHDTIIRKNNESPSIRNSEFAIIKVQIIVDMAVFTKHDNSGITDCTPIRMDIIDNKLLSITLLQYANIRKIFKVTHATSKMISTCV